MGIKNLSFVMYLAQPSSLDMERKGFRVVANIQSSEFTKKKGEEEWGEGDKGAKREQKGAKREPHVQWQASAARAARRTCQRLLHRPPWWRVVRAAKRSRCARSPAAIRMRKNQKNGMTKGRRVIGKATKKLNERSEPDNDETRRD